VTAVKLKLEEMSSSAAFLIAFMFFEGGSTVQGQPSALRHSLDLRGCGRRISKMKCHQEFNFMTRFSGSSWQFVSLPIR